MLKYFSLLLLVFALTACGTAPQICRPSSGNIIYITGQGWHTDIGIPANELGQNLAFYKKIFPGAEVIMFGYGKKTFVTAPPQTISEYILGPVPGPAVIHVVGLKIPPTEAYDPEDTYVLKLPPGSSKSLSEFIWNDLVKDASGKPQPVAHSDNPAGLFYAAVSEYNLLHTCNTWAADALHNAQLPISGDNVTFSGQVMSQVSDAALAQCGLLMHRN